MSNFISDADSKGWDDHSEDRPSIFLFGFSVPNKSVRLGSAIEARQESLVGN